MKTLLSVFLVLLFATSVPAGTWCTWSGTEGEHCQEDSRGYIRAPDGHLISADTECLTNNGFYPLTTTHPALGENQVRDQEVWEFVSHPVQGDKITKTWTVRDMTATEIDQGIAEPMPISEYYLWKALIVKGVITQQEAAAALPQELIDAYQARDRLENP